MALHFRSQLNGRYVAVRMSTGETRRPAFRKIGAGHVLEGTFEAEPGETPTPAELAEIEAFAVRERAALNDEKRLEAYRLPLKMRQVQRWLAEASDAELEGVSDALLFSMYELREALLRRRAQLARATGAGDDAERPGPAAK